MLSTGGPILSAKEQRLLENVRRLPGLDWQRLVESLPSTSVVRSSHVSRSRSRLHVTVEAGVNERHSELVQEAEEPMEVSMDESIEVEEHRSSSSPAAASISQSRSAEQAALAEFDIIDQQESWR